MPNILDTRDLRVELEELDELFEEIASEIDEARERFETAKEAVDEARDELEDAYGVELQEQCQDNLDEYLYEVADAENDLTDAEERLAEEYDEDKHNEIRAIFDEVSGAEHGVQLIEESYFTEYTKELCVDIGDIPSDLPDYIANNIDWDGVAGELKIDYSEIEYDGNTYYYRNC